MSGAQKPAARAKNADTSAGPDPAEVTRVEQHGTANPGVANPTLGERDGRFYYTFQVRHPEVLTEQAHAANRAETGRQAVNLGWFPTGEAELVRQESDARVDPDGVYRALTYAVPVVPNTIAGKARLSAERTDTPVSIVAGGGRSVAHVRGEEV